MKYIFAVLGILGIGAFIFYAFLQTPVSPSNSAEKSMMESSDKKYPKYVEIQKPSGFVNTEKITIEELVGKKVILVDILTYSCINCIRTFPYLNTWYEKYKDNGLEIVGIHTPEFAFEKKLENVQEAMKKYGIKFPVVLDNDFATWNAYNNRYWPHKYLIDIDGNIVYDHIGEGGYEETEKKIQELLEQRKQKLGMTNEVEKDMAQPAGVETVNSGRGQSPEIYFGAARNAGLGNGKIKVGVVQTFTEPKEIEPNTLYLVGDWSFTEEYAENKSANAKIIFKYQAQKVFFVGSSEPANVLKLSRDGKPLGSALGSSAKNGVVNVQADDLYRLIEDTVFGEHVLEIFIEKPGLKAFTFTFG